MLLKITTFLINLAPQLRPHRSSIASSLRSLHAELADRFYTDAPWEMYQLTGVDHVTGHRTGNRITGGKKNKGL